MLSIYALSFIDATSIFIYSKDRRNINELIDWIDWFVEYKTESSIKPQRHSSIMPGTAS